MNTLYFKYAVEVGKTGSITQAADNLYMAQPNLSKAIRELEDTVGIEIFERTSKGVAPTKKGVEFLNHAKNILAELEKLEDLRLPDSSGNQTLSIAIPRGSYISSCVTAFMSELDMSKPASVKIKETNSVDAVNIVADGQFKFGIIRYKAEYEKYFLDFLKEKGMESQTVWDFKCIALMPESHPLAGVDKITLDDLKKYVEILYGDMSVPYISSSEQFKKDNDLDSLRHYILLYDRCSQFDMLSSINSAFMLGSPVPDFLLERYGLVQRAYSGHGRRHKDVLIYPSGYAFSQWDMKFLDMLYAAKNAVAFKDYR